MKKEYSVVFHYSIRVHAEDEDTAEDMAWEMFGKGLDPTNTDDFACTIDEVVDVWATDEDGNYTCVYCTDSVPEEEVLGSREHGEPLCEGCYDRYKYGA